MTVADGESVTISDFSRIVSKALKKTRMEEGARDSLLATIDAQSKEGSPGLDKKKAEVLVEILDKVRFSSESSHML